MLDFSPHFYSHCRQQFLYYVLHQSQLNYYYIYFANCEFSFLGLLQDCLSLNFLLSRLKIANILQTDKMHLLNFSLVV